MSKVVHSSSVDVCVVGGAGHVGLPLSILLAIQGRTVRICDINQAALDTIAVGRMPFRENGAQPLLEKALATGRLELTPSPSAVAGASTVILTIGTPIDEFLNPTWRSIEQCVTSLLPFLSDGQLIVLRSTVYPGVTEWLAGFFASHGKRVSVAYCPERIAEGHAIEELQTLPQIVSGITPEAEQRATALFSTFVPSIV